MTLRPPSSVNNKPYCLGRNNFFHFGTETHCGCDEDPLLAVLGVIL